MDSVSTAICYYCGKAVSDPQIAYRHKLYYIRKRMRLWVGYEYSTTEVRVPRCRACYRKHRMFGMVYFVLYLLIAGVIFLWGYSDTHGSAWIWVFLGLFLSLFISYGLYKILVWPVFLSRFTNVPDEDDIAQYGPVAEMLKDGWLLSRPDPGSMPATGQERRESGTD